MERAALRSAGAYSRYGSTTYKQLYIYGGLDRSPTVLKRAFGFSWGIGGWLLPPFLERLGQEGADRLRARVVAELHSTFASHYAARITLSEALDVETLKRYAQQATGRNSRLRPTLPRAGEAHSAPPPALTPGHGVAVEGDHLRRYASVLPDFEGFWEALQRPLPQTLAVNDQRLSAEALAEGLAGAVSRHPSPGARARFAWRRRIDRGGTGVSAPGTSRCRRRLPPSRGPARGRARGSGAGSLRSAREQTALLALALKNRGTVIANDLQESRLAALHDLIRRLGLMNVSTTCGDGARLPLADNSFDRVLLDAPCTAEGKAQRGYLRASSETFRAGLRQTQRRLLEHALKLCRPGGRIVYSTCTFAPEENEAVITAFLEAFGGQVRVRPVPGLPPVRAPGSKPLKISAFTRTLCTPAVYGRSARERGLFSPYALRKSHQGAPTAQPSAPPPYPHRPRTLAYLICWLAMAGRRETSHPGA